MQSFERTIIICKIKNLPGQAEAKLCYVPELVSIQVSSHILLRRNINSALRNKINYLQQYQKQFGIGILPLKFSESKRFIEDLYDDILNNQLPLPANSLQNELNHKIKNYSDFSNNIINHEAKIKLQRNKLTFFAKYLPLIGTVVTFTLTIGLTYSALITIFGWGWSIPLLCVFGVCKLLTSYADVAGGPERRLLALGLWIDRHRSQIYKDYGKFSAPELCLNLLVISILICSTLLTWYGAWQMIRCLAGITHLPGTLASSVAGIFAWSSAGSTFGRIYNDLYQLLYRHLSRFFNFDNANETEKIDLKCLSEKLQPIKIPNQSINVISTPSPSILNQYQQQQHSNASDFDNIIAEPSPPLTQKIRYA